MHLENQALFSAKGKSKKLRCHLLQFLFGTLRAKKFCQIDKFQHGHAYLMILNFCKLDKILIVTAKKCDCKIYLWG